MSLTMETVWNSSVILQSEPLSHSHIQTLMGSRSLNKETSFTAADTDLDLSFYGFVLLWSN